MSHPNYNPLRKKKIRSQKESDLYNFLEYRFLKIEDLKSRVINHWEKEGIIDDNRIEGEGWRKYSPIDFVWLKVVDRLRAFNFSLDKIKKVKEGLLPLLKPRIIEFLNKKVDHRIIITSTSNVGVINAKRSKNYGSKDDYLHLNLTDILDEVFPHTLKEDVLHKNENLSKKELKLLLMLRSGLYNMIEIKARDGDIKLISADELIKDRRKYQDLVKDHNYQNITALIQDGKKIGYKRKVRIKP